jgi:hypothetical protein
MRYAFPPYKFLNRCRVFGFLVPDEEMAADDRDTFDKGEAGEGDLDDASGAA